jgi:hypothetical protein
LSDRARYYQVLNRLGDMLINVALNMVGPAPVRLSISCLMPPIGFFGSSCSHLMERIPLTGNAEQTIQKEEESWLSGHF